MCLAWGVDLLANMSDVWFVTGESDTSAGVEVGAVAQFHGTA